MGERGDATKPGGGGVADPSPMLAVVGIGASAGGLAALKAFFEHVPQESGLAFVVVVHLSPEHESHLAELLQPHIKMPVEQVTKTVRLEANRVFVIPPNRNLNTIDTHLRLSELEERRSERAPIDHFFRTLARTHDGHAIGVILTGTGSDGALGIREIKEKGGLTIVQDPNEAEYDGMPQSALATGSVDLVLPISRIPEAVLRFVRTEPRISAEAADLQGEERQLLQKIFAQLRARTGRDFGRYKRSTILRRIMRRMQLSHLEELSGYHNFLRERPDEVRALADDLLITVTSFFRDKEVFDKVAESVIPTLFRDRDSADEVRVWVVGCATGEEAYSLAMLLTEEASRRETPPRIQIFASDLHDRSLDQAREGFYPGDIETDVSVDRLRRFFQKEDGGYRIRREIRELVVFAPHNLLGDPPFSRIDLVTCRNLLIYLERDIQQDVAQLFHYALKPDGFLIVGPSETVEGSDLFRTLDKKHCIYRKKNVAVHEPRLPVFPLARARLLGHPTSFERAVDEPVVHGELHERMVERYAPPSLLVSSEDKVVHLSEHVGRFLVLPGGEVTANVFKLVREELRLELRATVQAARQHKTATRSRAVFLQLDGGAVPVVLDVRPALENAREGYVLVIFDEWTPLELERVAHRDASGAGKERADSPAEERERALENQLDHARQRLQAIVEEYETSQEEMKAANEELQSTNEELRSTMEELETSKEELQSMNEELQTVNQENRHKVEELAQLSSDLQNLLSATEIATMFLDRELRILRFTPKVGEIFNVRTTDRGRPLSDLTHRLGYEGLHADAEIVLLRLVRIEREVQDEAGQWFLVRLLPYRSTDDRIEGVVLTFVDISTSKTAQLALREGEQRLQLTLDAAEAGTWHFDFEAEKIHLDERARLILGTTAETLSPDKIWRVVHPQECDRLLHAARELLSEDRRGLGFAEDYRISWPDGSIRWIHVRGQLSFEGSSKARRPMRVAGVVLNVTARKEAEEALKDADRRKGEFLATLAHELRTPLAVLQSAVSVLDVGGAPEMLERARLLMERQLDQLVRLMNDLVDVRRIGLGKLDLHRSRVDLAAIVQQTIENRSLGEAGRTLEVALPKEPIELDADPLRLGQVFGNLLGNAYKFTQPGGRIKLSAKRRGRDVVVSMKDDGAGIPPDRLSDIFDMFTQLDGSREHPDGGIGIGLTLVKRLVELHGGSIEARSDGVGKGSEFVLRLPLAEQSLAQASASPDLPAGSHLSGLRILVVDDNRDAASSLAMFLERTNNDVRIAFDGEEAIRMAEAFGPDVIILDLGLPRIDGYEATRRIREQSWGKDIVIIAMTGRGEEADKQRSLDAELDGHLVKPVDPRTLGKLIGKSRVVRTAKSPEEAN